MYIIRIPLYVVKVCISGQDGHMSGDGAPPIAAWVRTQRERRRLSQAALAERMSEHGEYVEPSYVQQIEAGRVRRPRQPKLGQLAQALGVSEVDVIRATGEILIEEGPEPGNSIDPDEYTLRNIARELPHDDRRLLVDFAVLLSRRHSARYE